MALSKLFIPSKIKVGFQERSDTYTKKLAYVIYYDTRGVLRKATSWENWRDKKIEPVEYENIPTTGFVLNKGVGGVRQSYGWNTRNEYIRVWDPRDFEFEISVANLLFILRESDCSRGKGLEGQFVFAWDGTELVLLPENSEEYQSSTTFSGLKSKTVKSKELVPGAVYVMKSTDKVIYVGRFPYFHYPILNCGKTKPVNSLDKRYVFWSEKDDTFIFLTSLQSVSVREGEGIFGDYAELVERYLKSEYATKPVRLFIRKKEEEGYARMYYYRDYCFVEDPVRKVYTKYDVNNHTYLNPYIYKCEEVSLEDGEILVTRNGKIIYKYIRDEYSFRYLKKTGDLNSDWVEVEPSSLFVEHENGAICLFR